MPATPLPQISSRAWEHPADRAALNALRAIPGFDEVVRKVAGFITERGVRQLFLANAVKVGPQQRPALDALLTDVCTTLDWPDRPELYEALARLYKEKYKDHERAAEYYAKAATLPEAAPWDRRFSAYELSYCEGREREAYERLRSLYDEGKKEQLPTLIKRLKFLEDKLGIPQEQRILETGPLKR